MPLKALFLVDLEIHSVGRKPTMWFSNKSETNEAVQAQKMARGWKFRI